jgi:hypothetical protein
VRDTAEVEAARDLLGTLPPTRERSDAGESQPDQRMTGDRPAAEQLPAHTSEQPGQGPPAPKQDDYFDEAAPPVTVEPPPAPQEAAPAALATESSPPAPGEAEPAMAEALPVTGPLQQPPPTTVGTAPEGQQTPQDGQPQPTDRMALPVVSEASASSDHLAVTAPLQSEDRRALALRLTGEIRQDYRNAIYKLRRVHAEKLWQDLGYTSFGEYVLLEFRKCRKWGYDALTLLRAEECLEARGVADPLRTLSTEAALVFRKWENRPEVFVLAYQQIVERGEQPTQERLEHECGVQNDYLLEASQSPDLTQEEYRAYLRLSALPYTYQLDKNFQSAADLLEACRSLKRKPPLKAITQVARDGDLVALVQQLEPLSAEVARVKELKQQKADLEKEKRDLVKDLTEKIRQKDAEIEQAEGEEEGAAEDGDGEGGEDVTPTATADTTGGAGATAPEPRPHGPSLADLQADPKAFVEDATKRFELTASHPDVLEKAKDAMPALLTRTGTALDTIRLSLDKADGDVKSVEEALREPLD